MGCGWKKGKWAANGRRCGEGLYCVIRINKTSLILHHLPIRQTFSKITVHGPNGPRSDVIKESGLRPYT